MARYPQDAPEDQRIADLKTEVDRRYGIDLTPKETFFLWLVKTAHGVALRGFLIDRLWPEDEDAFDHDRQLCLRVLKYKLAKKLRGIIEIESVYGQGYLVRRWPDDLTTHSGEK